MTVLDVVWVLVGIALFFLSCIYEYVSKEMSVKFNQRVCGMQCSLLPKLTYFIEHFCPAERASRLFRDVRNYVAKYRHHIKRVATAIGLQFIRLLF